MRNLLIIGSTGRNSGKTELACSVVRALSDRHPVIGLKVSTIYDSSRGCLRGRDGCGVCTSVKGRYLLDEETAVAPGGPNAQKDTHRLLSAGADRVYWLRVKAAYLREAFDHFRSLVDPGAPVVCESNGLRSVVRPGLFLMLHSEAAGVVKPSAEAVMAEADCLVSFDGERFDPGPERIGFREGSFVLRR